MFEKVNLKKASFLDTNLERIGFRDVRWFRPKTWPRRRTALWDEFQSKQRKLDFEKVAENYRQLVLNYEKKRDYESAEDFHVGEMEMRRKKKGAGIRSRLSRTVRAWANSYAVYRFASNYTSRYGASSRAAKV